MNPVHSGFISITSFGTLGGSDHTTHEDLSGGRTAITTEALSAYNNLRDFLDLPAVRIEDVGHWAFSAGLTNNCLLYTSPSPRDPKTSRMPSSA